MMKKTLFAVGVLSLLLCSTIVVTATPSQPTVRLPLGYVTMRARDGHDSWFDMTFSDIPVGFDVVNGVYQGWCAQRNTTMTRNVDHTVTLYSSYDLAMPGRYRDDDWDLVNYVVNHKQGSRSSIEAVLWYYLCNDAYPSDPVAQAMIADADANGSDFIPQPGEVLAILVESVTQIQKTFFELQLPSLTPIGNLVWNDVDADGVQDAGEPGLFGVTVRLYNKNGTLADSATTDGHGYYSFAYFPQGEYYLEFILRQNYRFSPKDQGTDNTKDSDVDPSTGKTILTLFDPTQYDMSWDAGMYLVDEQGQPVPPGGGGEDLNHAPSADGTAGEPYNGFIGEAMLFNGSRSYDRDGSIVSWFWSFGDGTNASGSTVNHTYLDPGRYTVLLTVTDDDGVNDTYKTAALVQIPNRPPSQPQLIGARDGNQNVSYIFTVVTTDPDNDDVRYFIDWGDGVQNTSNFSTSGQNIHLMHRWISYGFYTIRVFAQDPSNATSDEFYAVIGIDVRYVENLGYLINTDGIGPFDAFYSNFTRNITMIQLQQNGGYLIDTDGDGTFDFDYQSQSDEPQSLPEQLYIALVILFIGILFVTLLVVASMFYGKRKRAKNQEHTETVEEWPTSPNEK